MAASSNKGDRDMAVLNFLASSMMMEESIWFDLVSASTHVDAGSQQFENLGPNVTCDKMSATASVKIE